MKVAILTQPLSTNYGGILQAWALQKVLQEMGHEPITVDRHYSTSGPLLRRRAGRVKRSLQSMIYKLGGRTLYSQNLKYIRRHQTKFIDSNIVRTHPVREEKFLYDFFSTTAIDALIVGSDQVWRPRYSPKLENYYLDFLEDSPQKIPVKISYAASFGVDEWEYSERQEARCKELIKNFEGVSVRELSAVELCRDKFNVEASLVLDPTLLVDRSDYVSEFCKGAGGKSKGVLTYILDPTDFKYRIVGEISNALKEKTFSRQPLPADPIIESKNLEAYCFPPTNEWVKAFFESKFVVTDSFHGVVFSIIFEKPFIAIANRGRGAARFESILGLLGLKNRLMYPGEDFEITDALKPIDFKAVAKRLGPLRESSINFLKQYL